MQGVRTYARLLASDDALTESVPAQAGGGSRANLKENDMSEVTLAIQQHASDSNFYDIFHPFTYNGSPEKKGGVPFRHGVL